jgi:hypothetical protein
MKMSGTVFIDPFFQEYTINYTFFVIKIVSFYLTVFMAKTTGRRVVKASFRCGLTRPKPDMPVV